ncbi:hypothetical protein RvY_18699 [Ramazzottius varieornatus]|uniref:Invertebrate defensins family profile domain-containing protein n=1 Tax=Ramazzottius varieornatus TaxID=947166 RepID=A0A1D1W6Q6_RAMVA|nr:hypothetical protein RvY_18699 [Ramazzottius varieornatus]
MSKLSLVVLAAMLVMAGASALRVSAEGRNVPHQHARVDDVPQLVADDALETRGFGCPLNEYQCHSHCKSLGGGRKGGYCGGPIKTTCICIFK